MLLQGIECCCLEILVYWHYRGIRCLTCLLLCQHMAVLAFAVVLCKILEAEQCRHVLSSVFHVLLSIRVSCGLALSVRGIFLACIFLSLALLLPACSSVFSLLHNFVLRFHRPGRTCRCRATAQFLCIGFIFLNCSI